MKKSDCKEALEIYKRFLTRVTKIGEFMKLAEVKVPPVCAEDLLTGICLLSNLDFIFFVLYCLICLNRGVITV